MADWGPDEVEPSVAALGSACDLLAAIPKVVVAAINGYALGGGMELALGADLRVIADDAKLGQPEIMLGVIPGAGGTQRLTRLLGPGRAAELVLTGRQLGADEALTIGLAHRTEAPATVFDSATREARAFARGPREALAAAKAAIHAAEQTLGREGLAQERALFLSLFGRHDQREGMRAFLEKREPQFGERAS
jgi:enoyl-CoA hydratase/carnithine racemase